MRRAADVSTLTCPVLVRERDVLDLLKFQLGLHSDADLVRVALWKLAIAEGAKVDRALFALRGGPQKRVVRRVAE